MRDQSIRVAAIAALTAGLLCLAYYAGAASSHGADRPVAPVSAARG